MEKKSNHTDFEELVKQHVGEDGNIPESAIGTIVTAIKNAVGNEYVDKDRYKAKLEEIDALKEQQQTAEDSVTTAARWEKKYKDTKAEFDAYKAEQTAKEVKATKQAAYRVLLKEAGISEKRLDSVLKVSDVDGLELDEDGNIDGKDKLIEGIKKEWADFISTTTTTGAQTPNPPVNNGGPRMTKEEIYAIKDPSERQRAIFENRELFGI